MLNLMPWAREVREIWVNAAGQRFVAEDSSDVTKLEHSVLRQEGAQFWLVLDSSGTGCRQSGASVGPRAVHF